MQGDPTLHVVEEKHDGQSTSMARRALAVAASARLLARRRRRVAVRGKRSKATDPTWSGGEGLAEGILGARRDLVQCDSM